MEENFSAGGYFTWEELPYRVIREEKKFFMEGGRFPGII